MKKLSAKFALLVLCFVMLTQTVLATDGTSFTVMQDSGMTLYVNGNPIYTTTTDGVKECPIVYDGTTYVRLNGVAQITKKTVTWDKDKKVIFFSDEGSGAVGSWFNASNSADTGGGRALWGSITYDNPISVKIIDGVTVSYKDSVRTTQVLTDDRDIFVPLRVVTDITGMYIEWNKYLRGVDVQTMAFKRAIDDFLTGTENKVNVPNGDLLGFRAYILNNIFRDNSIVYPWKYSGGDGVARFSVNRETIPQVLEQRDKNEAQVKQIVDSLSLDGLSDRDKVVKINNWVCDNYTYDHTVTTASMDIGPRKLEDILKNSKQICEGYARMSVMMCRAAGINAQYLVGYVTKDGQSVCHAWYRAYFDGKWWYTDPTVCDSASRKDRALLKTEAELNAVREERSVGIKN